MIIDTVRRTAAEKKNKNIGYNVLTDEYTDMIEAGVIDPVKVVRGALENAASIAAMILTTDVLITDMPEKEKRSCHASGRHGWHGLLRLTLNPSPYRRGFFIYIFAGTRRPTGQCASIPTLSIY